MSKPRKSTRDELLDKYADMNIEDQEAMLDNFELIHRQAKRRSGKNMELKEPGKNMELKEPRP